MASSCFAGITEETGKLIGGDSTGICANYTSANRQQRDLNLHSKTITAALEKDALERFMMSIFILCQTTSRHSKKAGGRNSYTQRFC